MIKKKVITIQFEFFKNVSPEQLEKTLRNMVRDKRFPAFSKCVPMVHYKNLRQKNVGDEIPLFVARGDIENVKTESES